MLSIMSRYKWRQLGILTSEVAGHDDFVQAVRDQITAAKADDRQVHGAAAATLDSSSPRAKWGSSESRLNFGLGMFLLHPNCSQKSGTQCWQRNGGREFRSVKRTARKGDVGKHLGRRRRRLPAEAKWRTAVPQLKRCGGGAIMNHDS